LAYPSGSLAEKAGIAYEVTLKGVPDKTIHTVMEEVSNTLALKGRPPASLNLLRRRVDKDIPEFLKVLRSRGYYGAQVEAKMDEKNDPVQITFEVDPGPLFLLKWVQIKIVGPDLAVQERLSNTEDLGLVPGKPCGMQTILNAQKKLLKELKGLGFPFPKLEERKVLVDHSDQSITIDFRLNTGPTASFGKTAFTGLESVREAFLQGRLPWKEGDLYNGYLLEEAHKGLINTRLFSIARVSGGASINEDGRLPITIHLKERKHRSVNIGAGYKTDEGVGGKINWEHRNFFGGGERVLLQAFASQIRYGTESQFSKPAFLRPDQSLLLKLRLADESPDGYTSRSVGSSVLMERILTQGVRLGAGPSIKFSRVEQLRVEESFTLLSLVTFFNWDTSDELLDPSRGGRLSLELVPFYEALEETSFLKAYANYRRYYQVGRTQFLVIAASGTIGTLTGASRDRIPADERFYAGGGGSVRGYAYQSVGQLVGGEPLGGRSLLELSLELRFKMTESIGVVTFLDGGNTFESEFPDFNISLLWGTGVGLRFYTPFGPFRLDAGFPLDRRDEIDDAFQVYLSIGQAF
jgi:translocation and assembly module TamA